MNICIGIISYFPDTIRDVRLLKLQNLIALCDELLDLPIIIIAQNWKDTTILEINLKITIHKYLNRLGITGARRALRNAFLSSEYDYMIMLDDDITLKGSELQFLHILELIKNNPNGYCKLKNLTLLLFAISKEVYLKVDFPNLDPVNGEFFEDMWLIMWLEKHFPRLEVKFDLVVDAVGNAIDDKYSTWYFKLFNKHNMGDATRALIRG